MPYAQPCATPNPQNVYALIGLLYFEIYRSLCYIRQNWAISTVVAHFLHTEGVTGSSPVSPIDLCQITSNLL